MGERTFPKIASDELEQVLAAMARRGLSMPTLGDAIERYRAFRADPVVQVNTRKPMLWLLRQAGLRPAGEFTKILQPFPIRGFLEPLYRLRFCRRGRTWLKLSSGVGPRCPGFQSWMPVRPHATYSLPDGLLAGLRQPRWLLLHKERVAP